jgi:Acetyltransferase (GNAT) domain
VARRRASAAVILDERRTADRTMQVTVYTPKHRDAWSRLIEASCNGTLFHSQDFLDYHPLGRFNWSHLIFGNPDEPFAVVPGALESDVEGHATYRSPAGATLGGPVLRPRLSLSQKIDLVQALVEHGRQAKWKSIVLGTVPSIYWQTPDDSLEFVLRDTGFVSTPQLMFYVPLRGAGAAADVLQLCPPSARREFRKALEQGMEIRPAETPEEIASFYEVLTLNKTAHAARPVHSLDELVWLKTRFPDRIRMLCALKDGAVVAGIYRVAATPRVSYTQYIADRPDTRSLEATRFVVFHALRELIESGFEILDLGPSVQLPVVRRGGAIFKESVGGIGCERRQWTLRLSD